MSSNSSKIGFEKLRSAAFGSITAAFTPVGTAFLNPIRILKLTNLTDAAIVYTLANPAILVPADYDDLPPYDIVPANGFVLYDFCSNASRPQTGYLEQSANSSVFVRRESGAPTSGNFYITAIYAV